MSPRTFAQSAAATAPAPQDEIPIHADDIKPVAIKHSYIPLYPEEARRDGEEGWVNLGFMVSAAGTPYEIYVKDSSGNPELERTALKAMESWTFQPALLNG